MRQGRRKALDRLYSAPAFGCAWPLTQASQSKLMMHLQYRRPHPTRREGLIDPIGFVGIFAGRRSDTLCCDGGYRGLRLRDYCFGTLYRRTQFARARD